MQWCWNMLFSESLMTLATVWTWNQPLQLFNRRDVLLSGAPRRRLLMNLKQDSYKSSGAVCEVFLLRVHDVHLQLDCLEALEQTTVATIIAKNVCNFHCILEWIHWMHYNRHAASTEGSATGRSSVRDLEIFQISEKFQDFTKDFKDFKIWLKISGISGFRQRFQGFREDFGDFKISRKTSQDIKAFWEISCHYSVICVCKNDGATDIWQGLVLMWKWRIASRPNPWAWDLLINC